MGKDLQLTYLFFWSGWSMDSQGIPRSWRLGCSNEVGGGGSYGVGKICGIQGRWDQGCREPQLVFYSELGMRLGDWIWRRGEI